MRYTRIWTDDDGESHFEDVDVPMSSAVYAPPAPAFDLTEAFAASRVLFFSLPVGFFGDWHPAPRSQFTLILGGQLEVQASDGEVRRMGPGDVVLSADLGGRGHITRVIGEVPATGAFVHLEAA